MAKREEYDWLDDPFNEKKAAEERAKAEAGGCGRLGLLLLVVVVALIALGIIGVLMLSALAGA